jgi:hypothetical protein
MRIERIAATTLLSAIFVTTATATAASPKESKKPAFPQMKYIKLVQPQEQLPPGMESGQDTAGAESEEYGRRLPWREYPGCKGRYRLEGWRGRIWYWWNCVKYAARLQYQGQNNTFYYYTEVGSNVRWAFAKRGYCNWWKCHNWCSCHCYCHCYCDCKYHIWRYTPKYGWRHFDYSCYIVLLRPYSE